MNKLPIFGAMVVASVLAIATGCGVHISNGWSNVDLTATTNVTQTAEIPASLKALKVDNRNGEVHIIGSDSNTNSWTWKLTVRARSEAVASRIASATKCEVEFNGEQLSLVVSLPDTLEAHSIESDFQISVPKTVSVSTQNRFGPTAIADVAGPVEARAENGRLDIQNIAGSVDARNSFDTLTVHHAGASTLHGQNGRIEAFDIGGRLDAGTSFDSLAAKNIGGAATLRNQNGRIEATGINGALDAQTSFSSLEVRNIGGPARLRDQNGSIEAEQVKGDADIETSFDGLHATQIEGDAVMKNQNGRITASGVTGSVKATTSFAGMEITGAGTKFVCHNENGSIHLHATSPALASIEAKTSFDSIEVHLPAALKPAIQAHTTFADVESDFPVLMKPRGDDPFAEVAPDVTRITLENQNGKIGVVRE